MSVYSKGYDYSNASEEEIFRCGLNTAVITTQFQASRLSTDGMTKEQREAFYTTYFGFFEEDCKTEICLNHNCKDDLHWCEAELPKIK